MSFFSFLRKNRESYSLVFNIGSGSISGGIIRFTEKAGVDILYYAEEMIPFQREILVPRHLDLMKSALATLAHKIQSEGTKKISQFKIDRVFYVFSSPWSVSQTKTIKIKESKAFKITDSYLNHVIEEQEKQFQVDISKSGKVIEKKIIQMKVNGYTVNNVNNVSAQDLELSVFFSVVPEEILQIIDKAVSKTFNVKNIWCHSLSLAIFSVIRNLFPQKEDFVYIDISEEITDIAIIKDNILASGASIPFGRNYFIRELAKTLKVPEKIADSMIKMHCSNNHDELTALKMSVAMNTISQKWLDKVSEILDVYKEKLYISESLFLVANNLTPYIKDKLQQKDFKILPVDNRNVRSAAVGENLIFKLELMFLDNLYKI